jgi:hypothetical protein
VVTAEAWRRIDAPKHTGIPNRRSGRTYTYSDGQRRVTVELGFVSERWEVIGLDIRAYPSVETSPSRKLTVAGLRGLPLGRLMERAGGELKEQLSEELEEGGPALFLDEQGHHRVSLSAVAAERGLQGLAQPRRRRGRPRYPDELIRSAAKIYQQESRVDAGRRAPTKAVAKQLWVSDSTARRLVRRAREMGLLPPAA